MKILVANLGSTSFKYRLFDMSNERELARGGVDRIGSTQAQSYVRSGSGPIKSVGPVADHAEAVAACLRLLTDMACGVLRNASELAAIGFKAVLAQGMSGVHRVDARVLAAIEACSEAAPAHNPPYARAMRLLADKLPQVVLVAAFENGYHESIPPADRCYAIPWEWTQDYGIRRNGFHGASHRYVAERTAQLLDRDDARLVSCHLGGSSSVCAIRSGRSIANSFGYSPQSGLPHNNRAGDFDPFALPEIMRNTGKTLEQVLDDLSHRSGLLGLSGISGDCRDLAARSAAGDSRARLALEVLVAAVRHWLGGCLVRLNGADAIVFTGGIGENSALIRQAVCADLDWFGIRLDPVRNRDASGEVPIHDVNSRVQIWIMPANEELIVARQTKALLQGQTQ